MECVTLNTVHVFSTTTFSHYRVVISLVYHNELQLTAYNAAFIVEISVASKTVAQELRILLVPFVPKYPQEHVFSQKTCS